MMRGKVGLQRANEYSHMTRTHLTSLCIKYQDSRCKAKDSWYLPQTRLILHLIDLLLHQ